MKFLAKRSDIIITHASEGIGFAEELAMGIKSKVLYFPHPVKNRLKTNSNSIKPIDILIWGTIAEYKGIDKFLDFL